MKSIKTHIIKASSGLVPALMPLAHIYILYKFWGKYSRRVDKRYCSCSCWDTVFKGTYESGIASYKHMYFNATGNMIKIWLITVACIITLYECLKYQIKLYLHSHLRSLMATLFVSSIFSHYYTWWVYVNYWNDDFYLQWNHQLFFTLTEILSTGLVLHISNSKIPISPKKIFIIISIAMVHILSGGLDQFVRNIIWGEGYVHQVLRDLAFVIPDVLHVVLPSIELVKSRKQNHLLLTNLKNDFMYMVGLIVFGFLIGAPEKSLTSQKRTDTCTEPEETLQELNLEIRGKSARLELLLERTNKLKRTIDDLDLKRGEIQLRYEDMLNHLRGDLSKYESEYLTLYSQIDKMMIKRHKMNAKLLETEIEMSLQLIKSESKWL